MTGRDRAVLTARVLDGDPLVAIARDYGITRERVRQIANEEDPRAVPLGRAVRRAWRIERAAVRAEVRHIVIAVCNGPCMTCTGPVTRPPMGRTDLHRHGQTCSRRCADLWRVCRYQLDDAVRTQRRMAHARWTAANHPDPVEQRHAHRYLIGQATSHGRWMIPGSKAEQALAEVAKLRQAVAATGESWWT